MALLVHKYGGTSVGTVERIHRVADRVAKAKGEGHDVVVVLSAMSGETDRLIRLAREVTAHPDERELDVLLSTGERVTIALLAMEIDQVFPWPNCGGTRRCRRERWWFARSRAMGSRTRIRPWVCRFSR